MAKSRVRLDALSMCALYGYAWLLSSNGSTADTAVGGGVPTLRALACALHASGECLLCEARPRISRGAAGGGDSARSLEQGLFVLLPQARELEASILLGRIESRPLLSGGGG